jgi:hypothetical protein
MPFRIKYEHSNYKMYYVGYGKFIDKAKLWPTLESTLKAINSATKRWGATLFDYCVIEELIINRTYTIDGNFTEINNNKLKPAKDWWKILQAYPYSLDKVLDSDGNMPNITDILINLSGAIGDANNFTAQLMRLIMKSDNSNKEKLSHEYPSEVFIVWMWEHEGVAQTGLLGL